MFVLNVICSFTKIMSWAHIFFIICICAKRADAFLHPQFPPPPSLLSLSSGLSVLVSEIEPCRILEDKDHSCVWSFVSSLCLTHRRHTINIFNKLVCSLLPEAHSPLWVLDEALPPAKNALSSLSHLCKSWLSLGTKNQALWNLIINKALFFFN